MTLPQAVSASALELTTESGATVGNIDATSNMADDKVYIYDGKSDSVVNPGKFIHVLLSLSIQETCAQEYFTTYDLISRTQESTVLAAGLRHEY
jgi:hypothetical protein